MRGDAREASRVARKRVAKLRLSAPVGRWLTPIGVQVVWFCDAC